MRKITFLIIAFTLVSCVNSSAEKKVAKDNSQMESFQVSEVEELSSAFNFTEGPAVDAEGNVIGHVTSGTQSPSLGKGIGMGYVNKEFAKEGSEIFIRIRKNDVKAQVVKTPFYKK